MANPNISVTFSFHVHHQLKVLLNLTTILMGNFRFFVVFFLFVGNSTTAQSPTDKILPNQLNKKYLEHLIKTKVDSVRAVHNCAALVNDSILYVASDHHAQYMIKNNRLTHVENNRLTRNPQDRAEYYGAINYLVGENVLQTNANSMVKSKKGKILNTGTYGGLATDIVVGWVNSPGHFKNIITPEYQITGVSVAENNGRVYACQKFAQVLYKYEFEESESFFSYSDYEASPVISSFAGIPRGLIDYKYEWKLRHDDLDKCADCFNMKNRQPFITLRYEKGSFILRVENSAYVQELIQDKKDGFAVEIVEYNDFVCGNPEYYTKPSRRNEQLMTDGIILKPLYKKDLLKGYKKRKRKKNVRFLSYLFGADSVKFSNRFSHYKTARYESEYFEINLGRLPKNVNGLWAHNLLYIQEGQICKTDYFTGYCGELFEDTVDFDFLPLDTVGKDYLFSSDSKAVDFEVPFKQNKAIYSTEDIAPLIESLNTVTYTIDSVYIKATASVEGDSVSNEVLQLKRAESIVAVLQENQQNIIPAQIETATAWDHFYKSIRQVPKYRHLASKSRPEIREALRDKETAANLEPLLALERKAEIELYVTIPPNEKNLPYLVEKEVKEITKNIALHPDSTATFFRQFRKLYAFVHKEVIDNAFAPEDLAKIRMPKGYEEDIDLAQQFLLYGFEFQNAFKYNQQWVADKDNVWNRVAGNDPLELSPIFVYDNAYFNTKKLITRGNADLPKIQGILDQLEPLRDLYITDHRAKQQIEALIFNLNSILVNQLLAGMPNDGADDAATAVQQMERYYKAHNRLDTTTALALAKIAVYYTNISQARSLTLDFMDHPDVLKYIVPLGYDHPSKPGMTPFYNYLIELSETVDEDTWCNLFMNECAIPFQAFEHEKLRDVFCEKCRDKNDYLNQEINP